MKVLFVLTALLFLAGCTENQELTGPWEMWILVCSPADGDVWECGSIQGHLVTWAAVPGENVRCDLVRNGEVITPLFGWRNKDSGEHLCQVDLSTVAKGEGFQVVLHDDQGFYGTSDVFTIR